MQKTSIVVTHVSRGQHYFGSHTLSKFTTLFIAIFLVALGLLVGFFLKNVSTSLTPIAQLGAIGHATTEEVPQMRVDSVAGSINMQTPPPSETHVAASTLTENIFLDAQKHSHMSELRESIALYQNTIAQLNIAIERIKNLSVETVNEFNQNCGNWKDDCAKGYTTTLDAYNSASSDALGRRDALARSLAKAERELRGLESE